MDKIAIASGLTPRPPEPAHVPPPAGPLRHGAGPTPTGPSGADSRTQLSVFALLWERKDQVIGQARDIAAALRAIDQADARARAIEQEIAAMVKNYPPFPPGSEERLRYLRSISALRQQLDALTIPPRPDVAAQAAAPPPPDVAAPDAVWQRHAEDLGRYRADLGRVKQALSEQLQRAGMWPDLGIGVSTEHIVRTALPQVTQGLAAHPVSLLRPETTAQALGLA